MTESAPKLADFYPALKVIQSTALENADGMSGAELWQWKTILQASLNFAPPAMVFETNPSFDLFLLRKWPSGIPDAEALSWIHRVIAHAYHEGCQCLALPIRNRSDQTFTRYDGDLWEVCQWKPGVANFLSEPNDRKLENMMQTLARFHKGAAQVNLDFNHSRNFQSRFRKLKELSSNEMALQRYQVPAANDSLTDHMVISHLLDLQNSFLAGAVPLASRLCETAENNISLNNVFPVQPVLRDIWSDHVLFTEDEVTGIIDYGAMQMDIVSLDLARLLGSTLDGSFGNPERWTQAIDCYRRVRPLSQAEMALIPWLDQAGVLLGSANWLDWLLIEQRKFSNWLKVTSRLRTLNQRLQKLTTES